MAESTNTPGSTPDLDSRQIADVIDRVACRYARKDGVHRDVVEAAVRSGWTKYDTATVTTYRAILAERAAMDALESWFGTPTDLGAE